MIRFLLLVMERMGFPEIFRRWIQMLHYEATTCLVPPNELSKSISMLFSFLQQEPLLRMLRATLTGLVFNNFKLIDKSYSDDVQTLSSERERERDIKAMTQCNCASTSYRHQITQMTNLEPHGNQNHCKAKAHHL